MSFTELGLGERMLKALEKLGFDMPTPIQAAMIPAALAGRDIRAGAETGSGKTAAFLLPLVQRLADTPAPASDTRALIVLPTRELAQQTARHCEAMAAFTKVGYELVTGGTGLREQQARLRRNPEIVIGTPGRLLEHLQKGSLVLGDVEVLVLDEADRMLDMGFREDVLALTQACKPTRQILLLSATIDHPGMARIAGEILNEPELISIGSHREQHAQIGQQFILADDNAHKRQLLVWLLANEQFEKALIFTNTRDYADELRRFLHSQHVKVGCLHGEMPHEERKKVMQRFRNESLPVLVATDIAARGLDISGVDLVVHFHLARSGDDFVHRSGRTGRAGRQGRAISLVSPQEWNDMQGIMRYLSLVPEKVEVEGMVARFAGEPASKPRREKKKDKPEKKKSAGDKAREKTRARHRNRKNIGKRRSPSAVQDAAERPMPRTSDRAGPDKGKAARDPAGKSAERRDAGFSPLRRKS